MLHHFSVVELKPILHKSGPYVAKNCFEESASEEVLVVSTRFGQGFFPVPSCNTPYLSVFLKGGHVDRSSLSNQRRQPTSLCPLTFIDEPFLSCICHYGATPVSTFCLKIVMMNPGFVNNDDTREKVVIF